MDDATSKSRCGQSARRRRGKKLVPTFHTPKYDSLIRYRGESDGLSCFPGTSNEEKNRLVGEIIASQMGAMRAGWGEWCLTGRRTKGEPGISFPRDVDGRATIYAGVAI